MLERREVLAGIAASIGAGKRTLRARAITGDDFRHGLGQWAIEAAQPATVSARGGVLDVVAPGGLTLWFRSVLTGPIAIDYDLQAVSAGGPFDRVSDANCFWMARDPAAPQGDVLAHPRNGRFEAYDTLETYYVGLGGNTNSTTRFRRYTGRSGDRPLLPGNDRRAAADMLVANAWQHLRITPRASGSPSPATAGRCSTSATPRPIAADISACVPPPAICGCATSSSPRLPDRS